MFFGGFNIKCSIKLSFDLSQLAGSSEYKEITFEISVSSPATETVIEDEADESTFFYFFLLFLPLFHSYMWRYRLNRKIRRTWDIFTRIRTCCWTKKRRKFWCFRQKFYYVFLLDGYCLPFCGTWTIFLYVFIYFQLNFSLAVLSN